jgi:hypothetical protein
VLKIEEVVSGLSDRNLRAVSKNTGLAYMTVWRVASGRTQKVSYQTVKALSDYLQRGSK